MNYRILIAGAGNIGSRYIQSLSLLSSALDVFVYNIDKLSLDLCSQRWEEIDFPKPNHNFIYITNLEQIPKYFDIVIVSSTSKDRHLIVNMISKKADVKFWILEKILAQNSKHLKNIFETTLNSDACWVNYYMSSQKLYEEVKKILNKRTPKKMLIDGNKWFMASNALHFIHLNSWFNDSQLKSLSFINKNQKWYKAKREGFYDLWGELYGLYENGGEIFLNSKPGPESDYAWKMKLKVSNESWEISEEKGFAIRSDGMTINENVPFQSQRDLVSQILSSGECSLPLLKDIYKTEILFLKKIRESWLYNKNQISDMLPIT